MYAAQLFMNIYLFVLLRSWINLTYFLKRLYKMSGVNETSILQTLETFLYTPYGLGTLAATAIVLTSLVWLLSCCICCCCWRYVKKRRNRLALGVAEADNDLRYVSTELCNTENGSRRLEPTSGGTGTRVGTEGTGIGTGSSGYQSHSGTFNYSLDSFHTEMFAHSSLDSILQQ